MKISVVIPLYNKVRHVLRALESVRNQTHRDFEVIVVDDGSSDGGGAVVQGMADPRIRLISQDNAGVSAARNRGIREASADWIAFLDADDEWRPSFLATVLDLQARFPRAALCATAYGFRAGDKSWRPAFQHCPEHSAGGLLEDYFLAMSGPPPFCSSSVMVSRRVLDEIGHFPLGMARGEDLFTWAKIALRHRLAWSPFDGAVVHLSADNRSWRGGPDTPDVPMVTAIEALLRSGEAPIAACDHVEEYLASIRLAHARSCILAGRKDWAAVQLGKTRGTRLHKIQRMALLFALWLPPRTCRFLISIRNLSGRLVGRMSAAVRQ